MDPLTIALLGVQYLGGQDEKRRKGILDSTEAKWSGFKGYSPFTSSAASSPLGDLAKTVNAGVAGYKWDKELNGKPKTGQIDETLAAKALNGQSGPDVPELQQYDELNGLEPDESQMYMELMKKLKSNGKQQPFAY